MFHAQHLTSTWPCSMTCSVPGRLVKINIFSEDTLKSQEIAPGAFTNELLMNDAFLGIVLLQQLNREIHHRATLSPLTMPCTSEILRVLCEGRGHHDTYVHTLPLLHPHEHPLMIKGNELTPAGCWKSFWETGNCSTKWSSNMRHV